jgi:hypothetical protein
MNVTERSGVMLCVVGKLSLTTAGRDKKDSNQLDRE